jgi:gluconate kinase
VFNVCPGCGIYSDEKLIDLEGPFAVCSHCGYRHGFVQLLLFILTGASGSGKSCICLELVARMSECVFLENDLFWRTEFATPEDNYYNFRNLCLRVAKNISQAGRPVVLCGSAIPEQYEACTERRYFSKTHYLALVCEEQELVRRLRDRPGWRKSSAPDVIGEMVKFNQWFIENADKTEPSMALLDNTHLSLEGTVERVADWIRSRLPSAQDCPPKMCEGN